MPHSVYVDENNNVVFTCEWTDDSWQEDTKITFLKVDNCKFECMRCFNKFIGMPGNAKCKKCDSIYVKGVE